MWEVICQKFDMFVVFEASDSLRSLLNIYGNMKKQETRNTRRQIFLFKNLIFNFFF